MRKQIAISTVMRKVQAMQLGHRYNYSLDPDEQGFLFAESVRPDEEKVAVVQDGNALFWDIDDDYLQNAPLEGRPFVHTVFDCYTYLKDYFAQLHGVTLPECEYEDEWWMKGFNHYRDHIEAAGFEPVQPPLQPGDVVAMTVNSGVINHTAVYVGDGKLAHHMGGTNSCVEPFRPAFMRWVVGYYRHKDL